MSETTASTAESNTSGGKYLALAAMMFAVSMTFIDQTIVAIAAPNIEQELGLSQEGVQWIINGYLLALAALFALGGRLADILGHKKMVLIGTIVFAGSSTLCGLTPIGSYSEAWIVFFRVVQGAGAAIMFPAALAIVVAAFPLNERGRALALFFGVSGALTALGPILGGFLTEWTWRAIFWVNIPVAIIAVILTLMSKDRTTAKRDSVDWRGAVLIVVGMGLSVLGFQQSSAWGWGSPKTIGCIVIGAIFLIAFVWAEARTEVPLIKVRIFKDRAFTVDNFALFFAMMAFIPVFFFISVYAQASLGYTSQNAGIFLMWFFVGFVIAAQIGGRMLDKGGAKLPLIVGCVVGMVGFAVWAMNTNQLSASAITPWIVVAGGGVGFMLGPASTDAVNRSIGASYGEVTGITQTLRNYGSALGFAILGTVFINSVNNGIVNSLVSLGVPQAQAEASVMSSSGGVSSSASSAPPAMQEQINNAIAGDFAQATTLVLWGMALAMALALIVAVFHPGGKVEISDESGAAPMPAGG